ncbi:hypothetical protein [Pseudoponticoccus marisrubri]|uniref:Uncharacterized protein n=1 Tax=Pseudoponticoccus marisrubri TaxID=1685382 RepID=A0A0W7WDX8_9RHOB|nr:hypothetical protein [Pseudoponticoccus marisrubri]KUF08833.1 hypothetical protein AVJ23_20760 [Pseudoponticoccus marisrubri]
MTGDTVDPKGLIAEAYRIEGITPAECRSIFLDWALSVPTGVDARALVAVLLSRHGAPGHPMTTVLRDGLDEAGAPRRRGGRGGRRR